MKENSQPPSWIPEVVAGTDLEKKKREVLMDISQYVLKFMGKRSGVNVRSEAFVTAQKEARTLTDEELLSNWKNEIVLLSDDVREALMQRSEERLREQGVIPWKYMNETPQE